MTPEITTLDQRLELGWARIDEANDAKNHTSAQSMTDFWITLLREYERACDAIRHRSQPQQERLI